MSAFILFTIIKKEDFHYFPITNLSKGSRICENRIKEPKVKNQERITNLKSDKL